MPRGELRAEVHPGGGAGTRAGQPGPTWTRL